MPITCPCCHSENVVVTCRATARYVVSGEFLGEQSWVQLDTARGDVQGVVCGDCGRRLGRWVVRDLLAALTPPAEEHSPFTHEENGEAQDCALILEGADEYNLGVDGERLVVSSGDKEFSCRLDAYEWFRAQRPGLNLPEAKEAPTDE